MKEKVRFLGLDVHAETIAVAVAESNGEVRSWGTIANRAESIRKLVKKLGPLDQLRACYEAGPTGYVLYWQLAELGVKCEVIAPTLVPMKAGDRVKTARQATAASPRSVDALELSCHTASRNITVTSIGGADFLLAQLSAFKISSFILLLRRLAERTRYSHFLLIPSVKAPRDAALCYLHR